jgi:ElaB/YqjD/DUF883 family membrane-anchored ribosome-binding protein
MKDSLFRTIVVAVSIIILVLLIAQYLPKFGVGEEVKWLKEPPGAIVMTVVAGMIVAMLVFLLKDRWNRIEAEMLTLRQAQQDSLDALQKRADLRISEKMDAVTRQAQAIRDRTANLLDQHPWIRGVTDADFTPDSCSCQIVLRNASKFVAQGQFPLAHEYLFNWTRVKKDRQNLEGSVFDFFELARFSSYVLGDEYLAMLMLGQGYRAASQRRLISPAYLKAMMRQGLTQDATVLADSIRQRVFPGWLTRTRRWFAGKSAFEPKPLIEEFTALAVFEGYVGNPESFGKAIAKAKSMVNTRNESAIAKSLIVLGEAEGSALLGDLVTANQLIQSLPEDKIKSIELCNEVAWVLKSVGRNDKAKELLKQASAIARDQIGEKRDPFSQHEQGEDDESGEAHWTGPIEQKPLQPTVVAKKPASEKQQNSSAPSTPPTVDSDDVELTESPKLPTEELAQRRTPSPDTKPQV